MEELILKNLQKYLEYIRYNTTDFGIRLLKPFSVCHYVYSQNKYKVFFDTNLIDCYWIEESEYNKFIQGKLINTVCLKMGNSFLDETRFGYYMSLSENKLESDPESLQFLFGLRFKLNDIFYKIQDVGYKKLTIPLVEDEVVDDNVKLYVVEDFYSKDFLEVNKFTDTSKYVKRGMGYSLEIDDDKTDDYVLLSDAKMAIEMSKKESLNYIISDLKQVFPLENKISQKVIYILKNRLLDEL
jgi:hypothetical protein